MENLISPEDVKEVATALKIELTDAQIEQIIEDYPSAQNDDPTGTWNLVVEQQIYSIIN